MTVAELDDHLRKQRRRLFEVRFQQATGQVENHRQVREIRHEIARAMTVKIEIERGLRPELARRPRPPSRRRSPSAVRARASQAGAAPRGPGRRSAHAVPVAESAAAVEARRGNRRRQEDVDE